MCRWIEDEGELPVTDLAEDLASQYDVSTSSVVAYSSAPIVVKEGVVSLRGAEDPYVPRWRPSRVAGLYQASTHSLIWHVDVDGDMLRGSGRAVPAEIAGFLAVSPGARATLSNPVHDVTLNWLATSHTGPNLGSLKAHVESLDAGQGDSLRLVFDRRDGSVVASLIGSTTLNEAPAERLERLTGLAVSDEGVRALFASALHVNASDVEESLRRRGDSDVADAFAALGA